jgi:endonuclease G
MPDDVLSRLKAANAHLGDADAALREELLERRGAASVAEESTGAPDVVVGGAVVNRAALSQETIVRRTGRPVLAVVQNQISGLDDGDARVWKARLTQAALPLSRAASAVGRIEVEGHALSWLGTGWLVAPDIVVTNRHVAAAFARRLGDGFVFRRSELGAPMSAAIDFLEEIGRRDSLVFQLERVLHIEEDDGPDLAFLRVSSAPGSMLAAPIALAGQAAQADDTVAVIGYPARDSRIPDTELMDRIFGNVYDKKRLAPGQVMRADGQRVQHDCSTLGGNSGSVVLSLRTGEAVGIHFAGTFLTTNLAVPGAVIAERLDAVTRGIVRRPVPVPPAPSKADAPPTVPGPALSSGIAAGAGAALTFTVPITLTVQMDAASGLTIGATAGTAAAADGTRADAQPARAPALRADRIDWPDDLFTAALAEALRAHDHSRADTLIDVFADHSRTCSLPYPAPSANRDLALLRRKRQFPLMRRYAEAVFASGTRNARVTRHYGLSLIELGLFDEARRVLDPLARDRAGDPEEAVEAQGLIGRSFKQQYVDSPQAPGAEDQLRRGIAAYQAVYDQDASRLWHGINVAACLARAVRDHFTWADGDRARSVAQAVFDRTETVDGTARAERPIDVWDVATRLEAAVMLNRPDDTAHALGAYLAHPDADAFEVAATHRQLTQVHQLAADDPVVRALWEAVERHRGGAGLSRDLSSAFERLTPAVAGAGATKPVPSGLPSDHIPVLLRVSTPAWPSAAIPGVDVRGRVGTTLAALVSPDGLDQLMHDPSVIAVERSRPASGPECVTSVPFINVLAHYTGRSGPYVERGDRALIAVIDNGIDVLHEAFLDASGASRIVGIWDQRGSGSPPEGFTFGTFYGPAEIAGMLASRSVPTALGRNPQGHGTHVASIAAGRQAGAFAGGVAPDASLLVVIASTTDSIGYSLTHVAALDFIDRVAARLDRPVVVNVSQGMNGGAHDGTSALEVAFNEFSKGGRRPGRVVVKSAGNDRAKKSHAHVTLAQDSQATLRWRRPAATVWPRERVELWWDSANDFEFRLGAPTSSTAAIATQWSAPVSERAPSASGLFAASPYRLDLIKRHIDNGDSQLVIEIGDTVASGSWSLEITGVAIPAEGSIHAWLERIDDATASTFETFDSPDMTLSIPGTAQNVITVGAVASAPPIRIGDFSAFGPTRDRREKPDVAAPGIAITAACGETSDGVVTMDGTSMAAPHVTGAIALVLSKAAKGGGPIPTSTQLSSALRQMTKNYTSRFDRGQGYGVIDVERLLGAFP